MKKITIIVTHLGYGGIQAYVKELSDFLCEEYKIEVVSIFKKDEEISLNKKVKIKYIMEFCSTKKEWITSLKNLNITEFISESVNNIKALYLKHTKLKKYIKQIDSDFIITTRIFDTKLVNKILKNKKIVKIMSEHNTPNDKMKQKVINATTNFDYVVFNSRLIYDIYKDDLKDKCKLINPVLNINSKKSKLDTNNLIAVGRFEKEKGFFDLIKVIELVKKEIKDIHLTLVGDGTLFNKIQEEIKRKKLEDNITLTGFLNHEEVSKLYTKSSIYLMSSHEESLGLVMLEAIGSGVPIVAFGSLGAKLILENGNGLILEKRNEKLMAETIVTLLKSKTKLKKLLNNPDFIKEYKRETVEKEWFKFLKEARVKKKILFMANSGGHLTELLKLEKLIRDNNSLLITEKVESTKNLKEKYNVYYFNYGTRSHMFSFIFRFLGNCFKSVYILFKFKPKFLITTGTHIAGPMCILAHLIKVKVIYIETMANISTKTSTGKLAYPFVDLFVVQWKEMLKVYPDKKTKYFGRII